MTVVLACKGRWRGKEVTTKAIGDTDDAGGDNGGDGGARRWRWAELPSTRSEKIEIAGGEDRGPERQTTVVR